MKITKELINKLKGYEFTLSPAIYDPQDKDRDKKPCSKKGADGKFHWSIHDTVKEDWTMEELLKAKRLGMFHEPSSTYDIDFDDKSFTAHKFSSLLPPTFSIGKIIDGVPTTTHKIYRKTDAAKVARWSYPKSVLNGSGKIIERLNKFTVLADQDRVITNDVKPVAADPEEILIKLKMIAAFAELYKHWPKKEGQRDDAHLKLAGFLAAETDVPLDVKQQFVKHLCGLTDDTEVDNRVNKLEYQELQFKKDPTQVYGIKSLATHLGVNLPACDILKIDNVEENKDRTIIFHNSLEFSKIEFPKPVYILDPYIREQTITAFVGETESGKTMTGMRMSASVANAKPFLDSTAVGRPRPTLYIEGDLPADDHKSREGAMIDYFNKRGWGWNREYFHLATMQQQMMAGRDGFAPLQSEQGQLEMENAIKEITQRTGQRVYVHFDNISILCDGFEENKAEAWSPLIKYFLKLKNQGHIINYHHHLNKGKDFSGSTMQVRAIDMAIRFKKLDSKHKIEMSGDKNVQCKIDFDIKWRLHGNSKHAKPFILTCDEQQNWKKLPLLDNNEFEIMRLYKDGYNVEEMCKEIGLAEKTIYKKLKKLKDNGIIKDEKPS